MSRPHKPVYVAQLEFEVFVVVVPELVVVAPVEAAVVLPNVEVVVVEVNEGFETVG